MSATYAAPQATECTDATPATQAGVGAEDGASKCHIPRTAEILSKVQEATTNVVHYVADEAQYLASATNERLGVVDTPSEPTAQHHAKG